MVKFTIKNTKNTSTSYISFDLNCSYYFCISYKENIDPHSKLKSADKFLVELQEFIAICYQKLYFAQKL